MEAEQWRISNRNDKNCDLCLFDDIVCVTEIDWLIDLRILSMDVVFDAKPEWSFGWIDDDIDDRMDENDVITRCWSWWLLLAWFLMLFYFYTSLMQKIIPEHLDWRHNVKGETRQGQ